MDDEIKRYRQAMFKLDRQGKSHKASASRALTANAIVMTLVMQCARADCLLMHLGGQSMLVAQELCLFRICNLLQS